MVRRIITTASATSSGSGVTTIPAVVDEELLNTNLTSPGSNRTAISQFDANSFVVAHWGINSSGLLEMSAVPFQVDNNGTITIGSQASVTNSSGNAISTTVMGDNGRGHISCVSRSYYTTNTYYIQHYQARSDGSLTLAVINRYSPGDIASGYAHPQAYGSPFKVGTPTSNYVTYGGSNQSGYGSITVWNNTGFSGNTALNAYSSTTVSCGALQWHGDTSDYGGFVADHRSQNSGWYLTKITGTGTVGNLGYTYLTLGTGVQPPYEMSAFAWQDTVNPSTANNRMIAVERGGKAYVASKDNVTTNPGASYLNLPYRQDIAGAGVLSQGFGKFAAGRNLFCMPCSGGFGGFYELVNLGNNNWRFDLVSNSVFAASPEMYEPQRTVTNGGAIARVAGNNNQFLVSVNGHKVQVRDISGVIDLSSYS